jgi:2'-5' RNA ligase
MFRRLIRKIRCRAGTSRDVEIAWVLPVSNEAGNHVRKLQFGILDRYGVNDGVKASPHVTVKMGYSIKLSDIESYSGYLEEVARETAPFEISIKGLGFFDEGIVFLGVENTDRLESFRRKMLVDLSKRFGIEPYPIEVDHFRFHVTLARGLSKGDIRNAYRDLEGQEPEFHFASDVLELVCYTGDQWVTYRRAKLCGR